MKRFLHSAVWISLALCMTFSVQAERLGLDQLSKTQRLKLWDMVERTGRFEAIANFCGIKTDLERRIAKALQPCVDDAAIGAARAHFRHGINTWRRMLVGVRKQEFCGDPDIKYLIRFHKSRGDKHISKINMLCRTCLAVGRCS